MTIEYGDGGPWSNLVDRMRNKQMNPRSLSLAAGMGATAIRDILRGRTKKPAYDTLVKIAGVLECDPSEIAPNGQSIPPAPVLHPRARAAASSSRRLLLQINQEVTPDQAARIYSILDEKP